MRDKYSRPASFMHPKTWERAEALMDPLECLTVDEVVAKLIREKYEELFPAGNNLNSSRINDIRQGAEETYDEDNTMP